jgi:hypothetical protein
LTRQDGGVTDEWDRLRAVLASEGIAGTEDLGRFVSNVEHFRPSAFDERAAMPILLRAPSPPLGSP